MSCKMNELQREKDRVQELGIVKSWLCGLTELIPHPQDMREMSEKYNMHASVMSGMDTYRLSYEDWKHLEPKHMLDRESGLVEFMAACSQKGVCVVVLDDRQKQDLQIKFHPELPFAVSRVFDKSYAEAVPALRGPKGCV